MDRLINKDDLFKAKVIHENKVVAIYDKILRRVHHKIKQIANLRHGFTECSYTIPRFIVGVPPYDLQGCIMYIVTSLIKNGFRVQYYEPQIIHISWKHWEKNYEISKHLIEDQQKNLIKNNMEKKKLIQLQNIKKQQELQKININRLQPQATSIRIQQPQVNENITSRRVRFEDDCNNHSMGFAKNVNMDNKNTDQNFYELEQIKKIQMLANQN
jgi:hypothetical protein